MLILLMPAGYALSFHGNTDNARDTEFAGLVENTLVGLFILVIFSLSNILFECNQQRKMGEVGGGDNLQRKWEKGGDD